ncbi:hypothetical protein C2G38_2207391 [Gigaspora rosea]|uniref:Uncharacterized protein n=1 Tax=Gigaspora rosea TaxID=44941 RepID=A0A397UR92_9GLOM|nr:hypothetical protein C2G38_2207391 [Gigaspora rosea]
MNIMISSRKGCSALLTTLTFEQHDMFLEIINKRYPEVLDNKQIPEALEIFLKVLENMIENERKIEVIYLSSSKMMPVNSSSKTSLENEIQERKKPKNGESDIEDLFDSVRSLFNCGSNYQNVRVDNDEYEAPEYSQASTPTLPGLFYYYQNRSDIEKEELLNFVGYQKSTKISSVLDVNNEASVIERNKNDDNILLYDHRKVTESHDKNDGYWEFGVEQKLVEMDHN